MSRPALLLALHEHLHVQGRPAGPLHPGAQGGHVEQEPGLVVHHAAPVEPPVLAHGGLEGRRLPVGQAARRLDVVVGVDQDGGRGGTRPEPGADHVGMRALHPQHLHPLEPCIAQQLGDALGGTLDLPRVKPRRGDAGDADEVAQLVECAVEARFQPL